MHCSTTSGEGTQATTLNPHASSDEKPWASVAPMSSESGVPTLAIINGAMRSIMMTSDLAEGHQGGFIPFEKAE